MSMKEIQQLHANKIDGKKLSDAPDQEPMVRGADGFLDYVKVPPPWKNRKGPYKMDYLYGDANWIFRKSDKAHYILGGTSIVLVSGLILINKFNPLLLQ